MKKIDGMWLIAVFALAVLSTTAMPTFSKAGRFVPAAEAAGAEKEFFGKDTAIYKADEAVIKAADPAAMHMVAARRCFASGKASHQSLSELFAYLFKLAEKKERTLLRVDRVFDPKEPLCAALWFLFLEK